MSIRLTAYLKYIALGIATTAILALSIAPFSKRLIEQWSRSDVEGRFRLVYNAIQGPVVLAIADGNLGRLASIFEGVAIDQRILAVGLCDDNGSLEQPTKLMPDRKSVV